jgi:tRNA-dihydrouridine synthase 1
MATESSTTNGAGPVKEKLFGRKFYESIGSPKYVIAPMVDQSELV